MSTTAHVIEGLIRLRGQDQYKRDLQEAQSTTDSSVAKMSQAFTKLAKGIVAAFSVRAVVNFTSTIVNAAAEVNAANAQFSATFKEVGDSATTMFNNVAKATGVMATRLRTAGTKAFAQFKGAGQDANTALKNTETYLNLAADAAAYYDISLEDADMRLRSFLRGNVEAGDAIGLFTSETQRNAKAMELYGQKYVKLTEEQKQMVMLNISEEIYRQSGALGQASRESGEYANQTGNLGEAWLHLKAAMGSKVLEAVIPVMQKLAGWMDDLRWKVEDFNAWIDENKSTISEWIGIAGTTLESFKQAWIVLWDDLRWKVNNFLDRFRPQLETLRTALAEFAGEAVSRFREAGNTISGAWDWIKGVISDALDFLTPYIQSFLDKVSGLGDNFWNAFDSVKNAVTTFIDWASPFFSALWDSITIGIGEWLSLLPEKWETMLDTISGLANAFTLVLKGDFEGAWNEIKAVFSDWVDYFKSLFEAIKNVFEPLKDFFFDYLWEPIKTVLNYVLGGIEDAVNAVVDVLNGKTVTGVRKFFAWLNPFGKTPDEVEAFDRVSLPRLAEGGVAESRTIAEIGEAGKEAIIPLEKSDVIATFAQKIAEILNAGDGGTGNYGSLDVHGIHSELADADSVLSDIQKRMRTITSNGDTWKNSLDSVLEYSTALNDQYDAQKDKLKMLNREYELAVAEGGEMSTNALETKDQIDSLTIALHDTQAEMYSITTLLGQYKEGMETLDAVSTSIWKKMSDGIAKVQEKFAEFINSTKNDFTDFMGSLGTIFESVTDMVDEYITPLFEAIQDLQEQQLENEIEALEAQYEELQELNESKLEDKEKSLDEENDALKQQLYDGKISYRDYINAVKANEQALSDYKNQLSDEEAAKEEELLKKKDELGKKQFESKKATDIASVWINLATAIMQTYAQTGWIAGSVLAALLTATAGVQTAAIASQQYVPALAKGGIVDEPTLSLIGEAGKEAVVPLENNTEWTREVAGALAPSLGGNSESLRAEVVQLRQMVADFFAWMQEGNVQVMMDGQIVGRLVSPYVNAQLGRTSVLRARGI